MSSSVRYQPLSVCLLALTLGIVFDRYFPHSVAVWRGVLILSACVWIPLHLRKFPKTASIALMFTCFAFGGLRHHLYWETYPVNEIGFYAKYEPEPACIEGVLIDLPRLIPPPPEDPMRQLPQDSRTMFTLRAERVRIGKAWENVSGKIAVILDGEMFELLPGERLRLFGRFSKPQPPQNPGDFDYRDHLRGKRILSRLRVSGPERIDVLASGSGGSSARILQQIRKTAASGFDRHMEKENSVLAKAMLLGIRDEIDEDTNEMMKRTGTMHVLAISGMHIGLIAGGIYFCLRLLRIPPKACAVFLSVSVIAYLFMTDVRPPAIRATILVLVVMTGLFFGRRTIALNSLAATGIFILLINPSDLFSFGPQLSFLACSVFLWLPALNRESKPGPNEEPNEAYERTFKAYAKQTCMKFARNIGSLFLVSLSIWCVCMPILIDFTHLFTPVAVLVNPLIWIPMTILLMSGFALMLSGWIIPPLSDFFGTICNFSCEFLQGMVGFFHSLPYGYSYVPGPPRWWMLGFYLPYAFLTLFPGTRPKRRIMLSLLLLWCAIGWCSGYVRDCLEAKADRTRVNVYSIGHGACVLARTHEGKTIICDAGCFSSPIRGSEVLSQGLWREGRTRIDAIILSHPDSDHYNSVPLLLERFSVGGIFVSPLFFTDEKDEGVRNLKKLIESKGVPIIELVQGETLDQYGIPGIKIYHPPRIPMSGADANNNNAGSVVFTIEHAGCRMILPGDLDTRRTAPFLEGEAVPCEAMMIPHHGGKSSMTEPLIEWTGAKHLIFSTGQFTYNKEKLDSFRDRGFEVHCTLEAGAIEILLEPDGMKVRPMCPSR